MGHPGWGWILDGDWGLGCCGWVVEGAMDAVAEFVEAEEVGAA